MRTQKQIDASRENGRKSQGAATPEGKDRIVRANLQHGIYAEYSVLQWEQQDELQELKDEYYARHPPASPEARCLVDQLILCEWHLRRFGNAEDALWNDIYNSTPYDAPKAPDPVACALVKGDHTFHRLQHRLNSTRRAFLTALKELERLEARDREAVLAGETPLPPTTRSPESDLPILGSLRKKDSGDPEDTEPEAARIHPGQNL